MVSAHSTFLSPVANNLLLFSIALFGDYLIPLEIINEIKVNRACEYACKMVRVPFTVFRYVIV